MGFRQWQEQVGRRVRKGERAIWILAPMTRKIREQDDNGTTRERKGPSSPGSSQYRSSTSPRPTAPNSRRHPSVPPPAKPPPVPSPDCATGSPPATSTRRRSSLTAIPKPAIASRDTPNRRPKKIVVDQRLSGAHKASTIAHELGHVHCGHVDGDYQEYVRHRGQMETEAEAVAFMVSRRRGASRAQTEAFSPGYIASWSRGKTENITAAMDRSTKAFNKIMEGDWPKGGGI